MGKQIESVPRGDAAAEPGCADEILREVWRIKDELSKRYDYDIHRMAEAARNRESRTSTSNDQP